MSKRAAFIARFCYSGAPWVFPRVYFSWKAVFCSLFNLCDPINVQHWMKHYCILCFSDYKRNSRFFCFWDEADLLFPKDKWKPWTLPVKQTQNTLRGGEKMVDQGPRDSTIGDASLLFCLIYSRLGYEQGWNPELSIGQHPKKTTKICSLWPKDQKRGILTRQKTFREWLLCCSQTPQRKLCPPLHLQQHRLFCQGTQTSTSARQWQGRTPSSTRAVHRLHMKITHHTKNQRTSDCVGKKKKINRCQQWARRH